MRTINVWSLVVAGACYTLIGTVQAAGDPSAGKYKFSTCSGCHGVPGYTNVYPTYHVPRLGGQHADYIIAALTEYQAGNRKHPTMRANASTLNEQDRSDIAAYLSGIGLGSSSHAQPPGDPAAGKRKSVTCAACHGENGISASAQFPILAGQHADYLLKALQDYKSGERKNAIMNGIAAGLSPEDQADLASYFADQSKGVVVVK